MKRWLKVSRIIDAMNDRIGRMTLWLTLIVVLIGSWNTLARYLGKFTGIQLGSNAYLELQWYLFSLMFLFAGAYALKKNEHVRVDVLFQRCSPRVQAWINITGTVLFLIPFCILIIWTSWFPVWESWRILETSPDPGGLVRYPIKTAIPVAFLLLLLQAVSELIKNVDQLGAPAPTAERGENSNAR